MCGLIPLAFKAVIKAFCGRMKDFLKKKGFVWTVLMQLHYNVQFRGQNPNENNAFQKEGLSNLTEPLWIRPCVRYMLLYLTWNLRISAASTVTTCSTCHGNVSKLSLQA
jgi:hypothetical protein